MAGRDWDASGEAADALRTVLDDYGASCLSNAQQLASVLRDLLPDRPREASVLVAAVEADVAAVLRDRIQVGMSPAAAAQQAVVVLEDRTGLAAAACQWAVAAFSTALGYPVAISDLTTETAATPPAPPAGLVPPQPAGTQADLPVAAAAPTPQGVPPDAYQAWAGTPAAAPAVPGDPPHMQAIAPDAYLVRPPVSPGQAQPGGLPAGALAPNAYMQPPPAPGPAAQPAGQPAADTAPPPTAVPGWSGTMAPDTGQPVSGQPAQPGLPQQAPLLPPQATAPGAAWPGATAPGGPSGGVGYQPTAMAQQYPQADAQPSLYPGVAVPTPDNALLEVRRKLFVAARLGFGAALLIAVYDFVAPYPLGAPFAITFALLGLSLAGSAVYASRRSSAVFGGGALFSASIASVAFLGNVESLYWTDAFFHRPGRATESSLVLLGALILAVVAAVYAARGLQLGPRKPIGFVGVLAAGAALFALANIPAQASERIGSESQALIHLFNHGESATETAASLAYLVLITLPLAIAALRVNSPAGRAGIWAGWIVAATAWPLWTTIAIAASPSSYGLTGYGEPLSADTGLYLVWTCWVLMLVLGAVALARKEPAQPQIAPPQGAAPPTLPPAGV
jgi:hypothetical protein